MSAVSHNNLIPGHMCTGSAHGAGAPGEVRAIHFPLPSRGGGTELATRKARLGGNWFSFFGGPPAPRALLLFLCSSPWVRPGWGCRPCSLLRAGGWCERGSCPHITLPIPFTFPSWDWEQELATREMELSKEASCLLRLSLGDRAKDDDCSVFGAPSG